MAKNSKPLLSKEEIADLLAPLPTDTALPSTPLKANARILLTAGSFNISHENLQALATGEKIPMDVPAFDEFELYFQDQRIGRAKLVTTDDGMAIELTAFSLPQGIASSPK